MAPLTPISEKAILVVEDEPLVRLDLVDMLESDGFRTYATSNADDAIAMMEAHPEIRVLFTDIDMPGSMDGLRLSHYVRGRWPPVAIFVTSGKALAGVLPSEASFIRKPYQLTDLEPMRKMLRAG